MRSVWSYAAAAGTLPFFGSITAAFTGGLLASPEDGGGPGGSDPTGVALSVGAAALDPSALSALFALILLLRPERIPPP